MTTPHPYATILRAIADGEVIQFEAHEGHWSDQGATATLIEISDEEYSPGRYRIKPSTITINGHEVPEPIRELPQDGVTVFWPSFGPDAGDDLTEKVGVGYYPKLLPAMLKQGLLHLTSEAASAHAAALVSITARS
jgi:hypothetical protein